MNKETIINEFIEAKVAYEKSLTQIEKMSDKIILSLCNENYVNILVEHECGAHNIVFDMFDEYIGDTVNNAVKHIFIQNDNIDGKNIRQIVVVDTDNYEYDFNEIPTDAQVQIAEAVISKLK